MSFGFDPDKPVQTRGGKIARIICKDKAGLKPIVSLQETEKGVETLWTHYPNGCYSMSENFTNDLMNVPDKKSVFRNIWKDSGAYSSDFNTFEAAYESSHFDYGNKRVKKSWLGIVELQFEDDKLVAVIFRGTEK